MIDLPSILITDDDRDLRETLRGVFEPRGFQTLLAADGEQALQIIQDQPVHVALLDMHMPRLTGLETLRRVKQVRAIVPCILMSARFSDELRCQAQSAAAFSCLAKPFSFRDVTRLVHEALVATWRD